MQSLKATFTFEKGYIADPYWPELERLINIQKESGMNRARSSARREQALSAHLESIDMDRDEYTAMEKAAKRPFYTGEEVTCGELDGHKPDEIIVPAHQLYGCLAETCDYVASAIRVARRENLRSVLQISDFWTGKRERDGIWERFVVVKSAAGKLSNQRSLRSDEYIERFSATGVVRFQDTDEPEKQARKVRQMLEYAGANVGVGAARKMGWGRFTVEMEA